MEDTENTQTQFTELPDDVQRRILLDAYTNDGIVTRITDTLHAQQTERIYYNGVTMVTMGRKGKGIFIEMSYQTQTQPMFTLIGVVLKCFKMVIKIE